MTRISLNALSLAPGVNDWLTNSRQPRILHIFDQACNFINERGEILSIVTPQIGNGPFNLVVADEVCFSDYLQLESIVSNSPIRLTLGDLNILIADAKIWSPRPEWELLHSKRDEILDQIKQLPITTYLKHSVFDMPFADYSRLLNRRGLQITQSLVSDLSLALANADISSARNLASQLAGLGAGLTPSCDDFLMGAIHAAWIIHPPDIASVLAREIAETAAPLTTSLSAAWLRSAGKGDAGNLWHEFFDALVSADSLQIQDAVNKILVVGETSGADAMAGFLGTCDSWMESADS